MIKDFFKNLYSTFEKITGPACFVMALVGLVSFLFNGLSIKWVIVIALGLSVIGILAAAVVTVILSINKRNRYTYSMPDDNVVGNQLKEAIKHWYEKEKYGEVVTFGRAIGRALYISACYETRIEIGQIVENAAKKLGDENLRVNVLLDDVGWTKFLCGKEGALSDINNALEIAKKTENYKAISKAFRHLFAIELSEEKNLEKAEEYLVQAYDACGKLSDGREKDSIYAGLYYAEAELDIKTKNYEHALEMAEKSKSIRKKLNEIDRHLRSYAQIGKIELLDPNGDIHDARSQFYKGIDESLSVNRIDELVKNAYGYACCCYKLGEKKRARKVTRDIIKKYGNIPLYSEDDILRSKYNQLVDNKK